MEGRMGVLWDCKKKKQLLDLLDCLEKMKVDLKTQKANHLVDMMGCAKESMMIGSLELLMA